MEQLTINACAKINLGLDVVQRLPNGYHQVKMVMQTIDLRDELTLEKIQDGIELTTDAKNLPTDESNLIYKAAKLMRETLSLRQGVRIHLKKNIPMAAGMGGGSADAAAALKGMNRLFHLDIPDRELMELGASLGADVPFCILGGTALAEGIGEKLTPLAPVPPCHVLVAKPDISVSTKYVYEHLNCPGLARHPDIDGMTDAIRRGSLRGILERMENVLESVTIPAYPVIASLKEEMRRLGAGGSLMSGSGPTVFGIFTEEAAAREAFLRLRGNPQAKQVFLTAPTQV